MKENKLLREEILEQIKSALMSASNICCRYHEFIEQDTFDLFNDIDLLFMRRGIDLQDIIDKIDGININEKEIKDDD